MQNQPSDLHIQEPETLPVIAITVGEPAGIGPEISLIAAWQSRHQCRSVLIGDVVFLRELAQRINPAIRLVSVSGEPHDLSDLSALLSTLIAVEKKKTSTEQESLIVLSCPLPFQVTPGTTDKRNGLAVLATLDLAIAAATQGIVDAIVTAPLQKSTINDAGVVFSGHTEYLAEKTNTDLVVMLLACEHLHRPLRVALATTHLPLRAVADAITMDSLGRILTIIHTDFQQKYRIAKPVILVTGLNPHAGENGYLGTEEITVIGPAILAAQARNIDARGPYPADTLFQPIHLDQADCVLAMYHDQGLPVLKHASFGLGVNITLGLPIIRTSVDHGTALDLAAKGVGHANTGSMLEALNVALTMSMHQRKNNQDTPHPIPHPL